MPSVYVPASSKSQKWLVVVPSPIWIFMGSSLRCSYPLFNCFGIITLVVELALKRISKNFKHIYSAMTRMCKNANPRGCYDFIKNRQVIKESSQQ